MLQRQSGKYCVTRALRGLLLAGCGIGLGAFATGSSSSPAQAQNPFSSVFGGGYQQNYQQQRRRTYRRRTVRRKTPRVPKTPPAWLTASESKDPIHVVVSLPKQQLTVYQGDKALTTSKVSSGKPGHTTPAGVFSILERKVRHFSNIYRGAPMPYMQRLTWSGIALHASSSVPNHPASHGCIRLPHSFAPQLFQATTKGAHVVIANEDDVAPKEVSHANLFQPVPPEQKPDFTGEDPAALIEGTIFEIDEKNTAPLRILVTRRTGREQFIEVQKMLNELSFGAGDEDGYMGPDTAGAIRRFQATYGLEKNGFMSPSLVSKLYEVLGRGEPLNGHLYVRQNFKPLFDAPMLIKGGDRPLGSHMMTAMHFEDDATSARWLGITLKRGSGRNSTYGKTAKKKKNKNKPNEVILTEATPEPSTAEEALGRVVIPDDVRNRVAKLLTPGSSLAITNDGISRETTPKGTDFVVLMQ